MRKYSIILTIYLILLIIHSALIVSFLLLFYSPTFPYLIYDALKIVRDTEGYLISDFEIEGIVNGIILVSVIVYVFNWVIIFAHSLLMKKVEERRLRRDEQN